MASKQPKRKPVAGWREWVQLPEFSADPIKAKIDTGARTSALHAFNLRIREQDGEQWAEFEVHPVQRSKAKSSQVSIPIHSFRRVRSSTGHAENRPVVRTLLRIGGHKYRIDLTLTSRDEMGFRMLLGRAAIRRRFLVDPGRSFIHAAPTVAKKRRKSDRE